MMNSEQQYNYNNNNNDNNMKEIRDPKWILDRRNSGRLFWRRDSGSFTCSDTDDSSRRNRVKFRCDVEVLEFWKPEYEQSSSSSSSSSDEYSDEDDCYGFRSQDKWRSKHPWRSKHDAADVPTPSTFIIGFMLAVLLVVVLYQWMTDEASVAA